jgi:hypothetical protein
MAGLADLAEAVRAVASEASNVVLAREELDAALSSSVADAAATSPHPRRCQPPLPQQQRPRPKRFRCGGRRDAPAWDARFW